MGRLCLCDRPFFLLALGGSAWCARTPVRLRSECAHVIVDAHYYDGESPSKVNDESFIFGVECGFPIKTFMFSLSFAVNYNFEPLRASFHRKATIRVGHLTFRHNSGRSEGRAVLTSQETLSIHNSLVGQVGNGPIYLARFKYAVVPRGPVDIRTFYKYRELSEIPKLDGEWPAS